MTTLYHGTLGDVTSATSSTGVYVGDLNDCVVTLVYSYTGTFVDTSSAATLEISQDGTRWASTPATSSCTYGAPEKSYPLTGRVQFVRITATQCDQGTFEGRFAGRKVDLNPARFGTLGDLASTNAGTAVDVSELEEIIVTSSDGSGNTTTIQTSYDGTDWVTAATLLTTTNSVLVPLPCKLLRAKCSTYSATEYVRYGGHKATGKQRFGTLGDFDSAETGTAVDISDLDSLSLNVVYTNDGTFVAAMTILIEGSCDGVSWCTVPSGSITGSGTLDITSDYQLLRARCSAYTVGTATVRFGGVDNGLVG
jgi:hypothetical protein